MYYDRSCYRNDGKLRGYQAVTGKPFEGVEVTNHAFQNGFSFLPSMIPAFILMVCLMFFAFTNYPWAGTITVKGVWNIFLTAT